MYRWVDKDGNVSYSDQVPPDQSRLERNVLNDSGRVIDTVSAAKTQEQIDLEKRLAILRTEQEKIIAKQNLNDKVLLSTFRNVDDLRLTLNSKLLAVDAQKRVYDKTQENLREDLAQARKRAAQAERSGHKVSQAILNEIAQIEKSIDVTDQEISKVIVKRQEIEKKFDKEIERFLFLTKTNKDNSKNVINEIAELKDADDLGLFSCEDANSCQLAWEEAKQFVVLNSTTGINYFTETLIMGNDPVKETDISLSVSKLMRKNNNDSIFLDIRCHNSSRGTELCLSKQVDLIRRSFGPYIQSAVKK
ncbi:hypothetical protein AU255_00900 [Methyloprofundus sedimenti]|uniref:DUF4124 domain-containing protein n=2 Tax=Methyloprofundus sedimenti TaxID=1420851 RepID=A0A1V8MAW0_9GAMM|nr:hypothetical protein AU255_00900 [Methyloprofundus sedimenti]